MLSFQSSKLIPLKSMDEIFKKSIMECDFEYDYPNPSGNDRLIRQIKELHPHWEGNVLVTNSATEATYLALSLLAGKTLALNVPSYFGVLRQIKELNINVLEWETVDDLEKLDSFDGILLTSNFTPPTGRSFSDDDKNKIAKIADKQKAIVIEDNAYEFLSYSVEKLTAVKADKTIRINSFSKVLTPNLRIGFLIAEESLFKKIRSKKITMNLSSSGISQSIISNILDNKMFIKEWQNEIKARAFEVKKCVKKHFKIDVDVFDGGSFIRLPITNIPISEFVLKAKEIGILIDDNKNQYINNESKPYIRLHLGAIEKQDIDKAIKKLSTII